jgi:hypothetical protein
MIEGSTFIAPLAEMPLDENANLYEARRVIEM